MDEEERKRNWMTVSLGTSLASEGIQCLFADLWEGSLISGTQNDIVVS